MAYKSKYTGSLIDSKLDSIPTAVATQSTNGLMSAADKKKLDGLNSSVIVYGPVILDGKLEYNNTFEKGGILLPKSIPTYRQPVYSTGSYTEITTGAVTSFSILGEGLSINSNTGAIISSRDVASIKNAIVTYTVTLNGTTSSTTFSQDYELFVDLGLPSGIKWATCNLGAENQEDYGEYFAWGETEGHVRGDDYGFSWANYKWCNGTSKTLTKYNYAKDYGICDYKRVLEPENDAAVQNIGGKWRMPTKAQFNELADNTNMEWTSINGKNGVKFINKNDNTKWIFMPAASQFNRTDLDDSHLYYWTRSISYNSYRAHNLNLYEGLYNSPNSDSDRNYGLPIRPILPPTPPEFVDLGLPSGTKWATCNIGAKSPEEYGQYYYWGDYRDLLQSINSSFSFSSYCFGTSSSTLTKYVTDSKYGTVDNRTELELIDDMATLLFYNNNIRIPSKKQFEELIANTTSQWVTINGINGRKFTAKNGSGNFIFIPANGYRSTSTYGGTLTSLAGLVGQLWSRSLYNSDSTQAYILGITSSNSYTTNYDRYYGLAIRPVLEP